MPASKLRVGDMVRNISFIFLNKAPDYFLSVFLQIYVEKNQRVPADLVLLRTSESSGAVFVRTDQLDGETDWKLRLAIPETQKLESDRLLFEMPAIIYVEKPQKDIHSFIGTFNRVMGCVSPSFFFSCNKIYLFIYLQCDGNQAQTSLNIENTLWGNTVVANGTALGVVVYTGCETRSVINNSQPRSKVGLFDREINNLTKV